MIYANNPQRILGGDGSVFIIFDLISRCLFFCQIFGIIFCLLFFRCLFVLFFGWISNSVKFRGLLRFIFLEWILLIYLSICLFIFRWFFLYFFLFSFVCEILRFFLFFRFFFCEILRAFKNVFAVYSSVEFLIVFFVLFLGFCFWFFWVFFFFFFFLCVFILQSNFKGYFWSCEGAGHILSFWCLLFFRWIFFLIFGVYYSA